MIRVPPFFRRDKAFVLLVLWLIVLTLLGGASRADVQSLLLLRPLAAIVAGVSLFSLDREAVRIHSPLFAAIGLLLLLCVVQLVPLPPDIWSSFPGRGLISQTTSALGLSETWRPISMVPWRTINSAFSLLVPFATLTLLAQLRRSDVFALLPLLLGLGVLSAIISLVQLVGPADGPLYFYDITNNGAAVGLFANRNHEAIFLALLLPMCAVFASAGVKTVEQLRRQQFVALACAALFVPLILVSRSRAGFIVGSIGVLGAVLLFRVPPLDRKARRSRRSFNPAILAPVGIFIAFIIVTVMAGRATGLDKLFQTDPVEESRYVMWATSWQAAKAYFPLGSGVGTFTEIYQIFEHADALQPNYVNHAHNDYLEVLVTGGLAAVMLIVAAAAAWLRCAWIQFAIATKGSVRESDDLFARLGLIVLLQMALASAVDYPLRTPCLSSVACVAAVWTWRGTRAARAKLGGNAPCVPSGTLSRGFRG
jgi:O-antigen ligase